MTRSRRRGGGRGRWLAALAVVLVAVLAVPAASYTTAEAPRGSSVGVADDPNGVVGLDVAAGVTKGQVDPLVNVTNRFDGAASVTVAIGANSGSSGTLYYDSDGDGALESQGTSVTFQAGAGGPVEEVYVDADNPNSQLSFDVTVDAPGVTASLPGRSTQVESGGGGGNNGNGNGGCDSPPCGN